MPLQVLNEHMLADAVSLDAELAAWEQASVNRRLQRMRELREQCEQREQFHV